MYIKYLSSFFSSAESLSVEGYSEDEDPSTSTSSAVQTACHQLHLSSGSSSRGKQQLEGTVHHNRADQLAHFAVTHSPKLQQQLKPHSASAPNSPRGPRRAPLPITVTSSATLKVTQQPSRSSTPVQIQTSSRSRPLSQNRNTLGAPAAASPAAVRNRSKSPNPRR